MTIHECISFVDEVKPNAFEQRSKVAWLAELEGKIAAEILLLAPAEMAQFRYTTTDLDKELLLESPYDDLYIKYLTAKVDSKNGEFNRMSTAAQAFNRAWNEFAAWFANRYAPADGYFGYERALAGIPEEGGEEFGIVE